MMSNVQIIITPFNIFNPNGYYVFKSYSEITFPFYLKCTEMTFDFETEPPPDRIGDYNSSSDKRETTDSVNIYKDIPKINLH